jgi:hypothetical protein
MGEAGIADLAADFVEQQREAAGGVAASALPRHHRVADVDGLLLARIEAEAKKKGAA